MPATVFPFTRIARLSTICRKFLLAGRSSGFELRFSAARGENVRRARIFARLSARAGKTTRKARVESDLSDFHDDFRLSPPSWSLAVCPALAFRFFLSSGSSWFLRRVKNETLNAKMLMTNFYFTNAWCLIFDILFIRSVLLSFWPCLSICIWFLLLY